MTESLMTHSLEICVGLRRRRANTNERRSAQSGALAHADGCAYPLWRNHQHPANPVDARAVTVDTRNIILKDGDMVAMASGLLLWLGALWLIYKGYHKQAAFLSVVTAVAVIWLGTITDGDAQDLPELVIPFIDRVMLFRCAQLCF